MQNNFPMKEWHVEHMQKTILKFVKGLPPDASSWERRNHKKYGSLRSVCRQIEYDLKHGVQLVDVFSAIANIQSDKSYRSLRCDRASMERLASIEEHFSAPKPIMRPW